MPLSLASGFKRGFNDILEWLVASDTRGAGQVLLGTGEDEAILPNAADRRDHPLSASDAASIEPPLIRITHEAGGQWRVSAPTGNCRGTFIDIAGALAFARQSYAAARATLWLSIDGLVVVIPQEAGWPQPVIGDAK